MPSVQVESSATLIAGIRDAFWDTWERDYKGLKEKLASIVEFVDSDKFQETYGFHESAPHFRRWPRGEGATWDAFGSKNFSIKNHDWVNGVGYHRNDLDDDLIRSLGKRAQSAGASFPILIERLLFQILLGSTDADLLPSIPNAPDGVALFSSSTRFGAANGNIISGSGVATVDAIHTDLFGGALVRVQQVQDTKGQPQWNPGLPEMGITIIYGVGNEKVFRQAFQQEFHVSAGATTDATAKNLVMSSQLKFDLLPTPRITDNDWYVAFHGVTVKPFIIQERQAIREVVSTMETDPIAARTKEEGIQWDARLGAGLNLPYGLYKINN